MELALVDSAKRQPTSQHDGPVTSSQVKRAFPVISIATISSGFEKGDFLVREEKGQRVYFDFFEEVRESSAPNNSTVRYELDSHLSHRGLDSHLSHRGHNYSLHCTLPAGIQLHRVQGIPADVG
ncbi:hypothetical protein THAOC_16658 [Thalassiosira oceanica]|uniref:Uncharacterized protein n=1 Tax=Thalassiosira oceanica TaxID=159749 RepID=K0S9D7_THAOC|nr:hypothetical protein THAOC_16658 [Thalassiosira oceanica]|eukprot:EJK62718.1 hypothetical protein THAOC_16658 [Thalassiosira oceanica]